MLRRSRAKKGPQVLPTFFWLMSLHHSQIAHLKLHNFVSLDFCEKAGSESAPRRLKPLQIHKVLPVHQMGLPSNGGNPMDEVQCWYDVTLSGLLSSQFQEPTLFTWCII
jgi:hypothetical protein